MKRAATLQVMSDIKPLLDALEKPPVTLDPESVIFAPFPGEGMCEGQLSVMVLAKTQDGRPVTVEILLRLLLSATEQLTGFAGGDPRESSPGCDFHDVRIEGTREDVPEELPDPIPQKTVLVDSLPSAFAAIRELAQVFIGQPECAVFHPDPRQALRCQSLTAFRRGCVALEELAKGMDEALGVIRQRPQAAH